MAPIRSKSALPAAPLALCLAALLCPLAALARVEKDRVTSLPMCDAPKCNVGVQYSGYTNVTTPQTVNHFHYVLVLAEQHETKPLVLWLNGGPGCSSMDGYFYEMGPAKWTSGFYPKEMHDNPYSWHNEANMLYVEQPVGVGWSYSDDGSYATNDTVTADQTYDWLVQWFKDWPEFLSHEFVIAGESYAGIYIPMLAVRVATNPQIRMKKLMLGNAVTNSIFDFDTEGNIPYLLSRGIITQELYDYIMGICNVADPPTNKNCLEAIKLAWYKFKYYDIYDYTALCATKKPPPNPRSLYGEAMNELAAKEGWKQHTVGLGPLTPCADQFAADEYGNLPGVAEAFHVDPKIDFMICSNTLNYTYTMQKPMNELLLPLMATGVKVLYYTGDMGAGIPWNGALNYVKNNFALPMNKTSYWNAWVYDSKYGTQVGGRYVDFPGGNLTYVTVLGAGHMVPQYRPPSALAMLQQFLSGEWKLTD